MIEKTTKLSATVCLMMRLHRKRLVKSALFLFGAGLVLGMLGCAGARSGTDSSALVNFTFTLQGAPHRLSEFRGKPAAVVLMRTSEMVSQIYMIRLSEAYPKIKDAVRLIVLTVEPTEIPFVDAYREIEKLPFALGAAEADVLLGKSQLGLIPFIPFTLFVDETGAVVHQVPGVIEADNIIKAVDRFFR